MSHKTQRFLSAEYEQFAFSRIKEAVTGGFMDAKAVFRLTVRTNGHAEIGLHDTEGTGMSCIFKPEEIDELVAALQCAKLTSEANTKAYAKAQRLQELGLPKRDLGEAMKN